MSEPTRIVRAEDAVRYEPPGHHGVQARRLQGLQAGGPTRCSVAISEYPPGAQARWAATPNDVVYVVLAGHLQLTTNTDDLALGVHDSAYLATGTLRSLVNRGQAPATLLVVAMTEPDVAAS